MIIKSMSRKSPDFVQILNYINKGDQGENRAIFHNLRSGVDDVRVIADEFVENAEYIRSRKNGVIFYHEILSLSGKNSRNFSGDMLEDLAREYMVLRAPFSLGYAKAHLDTDHPHIHFCISANNVREQCKHRLSRVEFEGVKRGIRQFHRYKYPEILGHEKKSNIFREKSALPFLSGRRGETIKDYLREKITEIFDSERCLSDALSVLKKSDIELYSRGNHDLYGVIYGGRKYRLSTLGVRGVVNGRVKGWGVRDGRLSELDRLREEREMRREKDKILSF